MKVVIATPFYPPEVGVLANYAAGLKRGLEKYTTVEVVALGNLKRVPAGIRHVLYFFKLLTALRGASCVLALDTWTVGFPALIASRVTGVPLVVRIGGDLLWEAYLERTHESARLSEFYTNPRRLAPREKLLQAVAAALCAHARHVFFNTQFQKEIWEQAYPLAGKSSVLENFYPPKESYEPPAGRAFVAANRGAWYKNMDRFMRVFERVKARYPLIEMQTSFVPYEKQLERFAASYAAVVPSISEVGSNIAIEAVIHGRPFIISEDTGTKERLDGCGLFIDTRSEQAIEQALEDILDQGTYARLVENCKHFSFTHSWEEIAQEILQRV